ncbi:MAG: DUF1080 domain-containing protein, partial [Planctomycetota bacterium]|nr:DUF1080 domain-containing protein [Planctomycetota bacterium]
MFHSQVQGQESEWTDLFNGKNLEGWYGLKTMDPRKMKAMSKAEFDAFAESTRAETEKHWTVDPNGDLVNDGKGAYLTTRGEYGDYELLIDYKTVAKADSGIYLKATPQVQIWDFTKAGGKWGIGADKGSGGLWNNSKGAPGKDPLVLADKPFGEWNSVRILQVGSRTTIHLNGKLVVDHAIMENYWDRKQPLVRKGPIQLQTHGGEIRWKNIKIREISPQEANRILMAKSKRETEYQSVFNGKDFDGWAGPIDNYQVVEGGILMCKKGKGGTIFTKDVYEDFKVRLEFKLPPRGNNGLAIRYPGSGNTAYIGMCELQVLNYDYPGKLDDRQYHGSAYGMAAAAKGYLRKTGEWNFQEVTVKGSTIRVELNGSVILNTDLSKISKYMANSAHPGKDNKKGHFGFAGHSDPVQFRNIAIKKL